MVSSYVGENAEFERQYLNGELEVELTPQVRVVAACRQFSRQAVVCTCRVLWLRGSGVVELVSPPSTRPPPMVH